jgi:hypothetical protein
MMLLGPEKTVSVRRYGIGGGYLAFRENILRNYDVSGIIHHEEMYLHALYKTEWSVAMDSHTGAEIHTPYVIIT